MDGSQGAAQDSDGKRVPHLLPEGGCILNKDQGGPCWPGGVGSRGVPQA